MTWLTDEEIAIHREQRLRKRTGKAYAIKAFIFIVLVPYFFLCSDEIENASSFQFGREYIILDESIFYDTWTCPLCGYENWDLINSCGICGYER